MVMRLMPTNYKILNSIHEHYLPISLYGSIYMGDHLYMATDGNEVVALVYSMRGEIEKVSQNGKK